MLQERRFGAITRRIVVPSALSPWLPLPPCPWVLWWFRARRATAPRSSRCLRPQSRRPPRWSWTSTYTYPHTVENGAGERITFVRRVQDSAGDRLEVENHLKPGSGPPMNIHNHHPSPARRRGFFLPYNADVENRVLGGTGVEPTQTSPPRRQASSTPRPTTTRWPSSSPTARRAFSWPATRRPGRSTWRAVRTPGL
jgi:hypothetical protein